MSFILGFAFPAFALVACDTRMNVLSSAGERGYNDRDPLSIDFRDGSRYAVPEWGRKISRYDWGWLATGGNAALLGKACMDDLRSRPVDHSGEIGERILACAKRQGPHLRVQFGNPPETPDRVAAVYTFNSPTGLQVGSVDTSVRQHTPTTNAFRLAAPPDVPGAVHVALQRDLSEKLVQK